MSRQIDANVESAGQLRRIATGEVELNVRIAALALNWLATQERRA